MLIDGKSYVTYDRSEEYQVVRLTDMDNKQIFKDKKQLEIIKDFCMEEVVLKPDKGNGKVLVRYTGYYNALENLFSDQTKFKQIEKDPTTAHLTSMQRYFKKLDILKR